MLNPLCSFYLLGVPSTRKSPIAVIIKDLHPSFLPFVTPSPTLYSTDALFKHSRDCLYLVKPDNCFKAKLERWLNFASVLHFRKWSIEQPGLLVFSAKSKSLKPPGAFIYFERVADLKRSSMWMCSHGQKCRKMEYGNGHRRCLSRWMMKHAKKIAQDKEWEKGWGEEELSLEILFFLLFWQKMYVL